MRGRKTASNAGGRAATAELNKIGSFGIDALLGYGGKGGGGSAFADPTTFVLIAAWVAVLFRFVLFYGFFE